MKIIVEFLVSQAAALSDGVQKNRELHLELLLWNRFGGIGCGKGDRGIWKGLSLCGSLWKRRSMKLRHKRKV